MPYYPTLQETGRSQETVDVFSGYNHNLRISDGQLYDMKNLSGDAYPLLSARQKRGEVSTLTAPKVMLAKEELAYIDGTSLYYGGVDVTSYLTAAGVAIGSDSAVRQMVSMGAYLVIFPDKLYFNTEDFDDCGALERVFDTTFSASNKVFFYLCREDGTMYPTPATGDTPPDSPTEGDTWYAKSEVDGVTQQITYVLKQYSADTASWSTISTVYTKICCTGIGVGFKKHDGVKISGLAGGSILNADGSSTVTNYYQYPTYGGAGTTSGEQVEATPADMYPGIKALNGEKVIYDRGDDFIMVKGTAAHGFSQSQGRMIVERKTPDMDFVTEAQNRLWGCKFGVVYGKTVNEIYACALGDFRNWSKYEGISTDSYTASVGTDGPWTGAITHLGYPLFFKENSLHKVYVSPAGAHRISDCVCRGVQRGSGKSLRVVNEILYYKAQSDIVAYDGSLPVSVSAALGTERYSDAVAGGLGDKYYISMKDAADHWHMFVLDTLRGVWHREDDTHALAFAALDGELYYMDAAASKLIAVSGSTGTVETDVDWEAITGIYGTDYAGHKYVGRLNLRLRLPRGSSADVYIQYDSDGVWRHSGHMDGVGTGSFTLPVRPRRCDHFRLKLTGSGDMRLFSITKVLEKGSDE